MKMQVCLQFGTELVKEILIGYGFQNTIAVQERLAEAANVIVIDYHVARGLEINLNDVVSLGAGFGKMDYTVVGIGLHSNHFYFAEQGSIIPADVGTFATGYLSVEGLEKLANVSSGTSNTLLIDVKGTPAYDLQSTSENEGPELKSLIENLTVSFSIQDGISVVVHDRSGQRSVEFLRADVRCKKNVSLRYWNDYSYCGSYNLPQSTEVNTVTS